MYLFSFTNKASPGHLHPNMLYAGLVYTTVSLSLSLSLSLPLSHPFPLAVTPPPNHHSNNYTFFLPFLSYSEWLSHCMLRLPVACGDFREFVMTAPLPLGRSCLEFPRRRGKGDAREGWAASTRMFLGFNGTLDTLHSPHHDCDGCWTSQHVLKYSKVRWPSLF